MNVFPIEIGASVVRCVDCDVELALDEAALIEHGKDCHA